MNVINVVLEGAEKEITLTGGTHARIENRSDSTIYVSKHSGITPDAEGVMAIDGGSSNVLTDVATTDVKDGVVDYYGTIYALGTGKVQIVTTNYPFSSSSKGGGDSSGSTVQIYADGDMLMINAGTTAMRESVSSVDMGSNIISKSDVVVTDLEG